MGKMCLSWRRSQLIMAVERNKNVIFPTRTLLIPIGRLKKFPHSNFYCLGSRSGDDRRVCHDDLLQLSLLSHLNSKLIFGFVAKLSIQHCFSTVLADLWETK